MADREDEIKQRIIDYSTTFGSESGKRVLDRLSLLCNENEPTYVDGNSMGTAYKEGQRSIILHLRKMLGKSPDKKRQSIAKGA